MDNSLRAIPPPVWRKRNDFLCPADLFDCFGGRDYNSLTTFAEKEAETPGVNILAAEHEPLLGMTF